ncbi:hypothetical protein AG1IA_01932 [Rhizoctonia solani AG-1 IA]|uniref:Uncharacterized protein n=1 Tax=Thanatephorus cucumeris (strain AG1-IA) TaxID=983506 RepID=L8X5W8_THACA|nr:hypothetical protein AG1IA_01932 [Rhizoctonia solani AG-1 IA]
MFVSIRLISITDVFDQNLIQSGMKIYKGENRDLIEKFMAGRRIPGVEYTVRKGSTRPFLSLNLHDDHGEATWAAFASTKKVVCGSIGEVQYIRYLKEASFIANMIHSPLARILAIAFIVLSFSMLVWGAPVEAGKNLLARGGTCSVGCTTGNQVVDILVKLKADIAIKLDLLDACYNSGVDPAGIVADIVVLINAAVALILACPRDLSGLRSHSQDIASHCGKWSDKPNFDVFLGLIVVIDVALKGLLSACGGLLGTILGLIAGLLGGANLALLLKVKFNLCVGILGL